MSAACSKHTWNSVAVVGALERKLVEMVRQARPLYRPPETLRERVAQTLQASRPAALLRRSRPLMLLMAVAVVGLGFSLLWTLMRAPLPAFTSSAFALAAVDAHQRYTRGQVTIGSRK